MHYVWWKGDADRFIVGRHTRAICDRITKGVHDFMNGISTFLVVSVPIGHGKSDIVSRALPAFFLGVCYSRHPDIILTGYGAELVEGFSNQARDIVAGERYQTLFPDVKLSSQKNTQSLWKVEGSTGSVLAVGLGGAVTGHRANLLDCDDYIQNRKQAESTTQRNHINDSFTNDLMTRRASVCLTVICASRWHAKDLIGFIEVRMTEDPNFPKFEFLSFPATKKPAGDDPGYEYLFPERYSPAWYKSQRATLGKYGASGLLDLKPKVRGGNRFLIDNVKILKPDQWPKDLRYVRSWDPASSQKQRKEDDPDFTAGAKVAVTYENNLPVLWIHDVVAIQQEAPARNRRIYMTALQDGPTVAILVEGVGQGKDTYTTVKDALRGKRSVIRVQVSGDKGVRAAPLEPIFEAGNVRLLEAPWNDVVIEQFAAFPSTGEHDDIVDCVATAYEHLRKKEEGWGMNLGVSYPKG